MSGRGPGAGEDALRASDAERDRVVEVLADAAAEGRLTLEEYSARSDAALSARTRGELGVVTADLPDSSGLPAVLASTAPAEHINVLLGNESRKGRWVVPPRLFIRSVLSDCHLELQQAVIRQRVTVIEARVRFGAVTIFVPDGVEVRVSGRSVLGEKSSELQAAPRPGAPVIEVRCDIFCGSVNVRRPKLLMRW